MPIEVVRYGDIVDVTPDVVPLSSVSYSDRTCRQKVTCTECRHQFHPSQVHRTCDGFVCGSCRDDS